MHNLEFRVRTVGDVTVVSVGGKQGQPLPESVGLLGLIDQGVKKLVMDLTGAPFLASASIGELLVVERKATQADVEYRLCCPDASLREVFSITKLDQLLSVHATLDEALAGL